MSTRQEIHLIEAVEAGDTARVRHLLSTESIGVNVHTRKRVKLSARVEIGNQMVKQSDAIECESLLGLAVMYGFLDIVVALLEHGADPNVKIEWKLANRFISWNPEDWSLRRWWYTHSFPNALSLALGRGGTWRRWDGQPGELPHKENGTIGVNKLGGSVRVDG
ncbi:hypothetical protein HDU93_003155, partial [Gonapodya sp. JEL0774]